MKTRNGFVSNSSSSSFVVLFPNKPNTKEELKEMMFPEFRWDEIIKGEYDDLPTATVEQIVDRVFCDINSGQKDRYNAEFEFAFEGYIEEIHGEHTLTRILYDRYISAMYEAGDKYRKLVDKYGEDNWDSHKEDEMYKDWVKASKEEIKSEDEWKKEKDKSAKKMYSGFKERYKYHKYQHIFEYGDRHGEYVFENGYIFRNLPHIVISNH